MSWCELVVPKSIVNQVWDSLVDGGVTPCGLGARDTLRLEAATLWPRIIRNNISASDTVSVGCDFNKSFVGKDALLKQKSKLLKKRGH